MVKSTRSKNRSRIKRNSKGKGSISIKKDDDTVCTDNVEASMVDSQLSFSDKGVIKCPNETSFRPPRVKYADSSDEGTLCKGSFQEGDSFNMDIKKQ